MLAPDPDAARTMRQMTTYLLTRVEEFIHRYRMVMAVRIIVLRRPPCADSVPMELLQQTPLGLIEMEFARAEPLSLDRVLLMPPARRLI